MGMEFCAGVGLLFRKHHCYSWYYVFFISASIDDVYASLRVLLNIQESYRCSYLLEYALHLENQPVPRQSRVLSL